jgi:hypothetical protein
MHEGHHHTIEIGLGDGVERCKVRLSANTDIAIPSAGME